MTIEREQRKQFTRRTLLFSGGMLLVGSGLVARLFDLQVRNESRYRKLADDNRINVRMLSPPRGTISDRFGEELAINRRAYQLVLVPEQTDNVATTLERLSAHIEIPEHDWRQVLRLAGKQHGFVPVEVSQNLSWRDVARIEVNLPELPGVQIDVVQHRYYPHSELTAHVIGYVGAVSESEVSGNHLALLPGIRTGKSGIEKIYEKSLRGSEGTRHVEVNVVGREVRELTRIKARAGENIRTTLDMRLQAFTGRRMQDTPGSVIVLDVANGDVLTSVSSPSFDPNAFNYGFGSDAWAQLLNNPHTPLLNKSVAGQYPPASTFKMIVALAALEHRLVSPDDHFYCPGSYELGSHVFHCWNKNGHGSVGLIEGIKRSCDVYFYKVAELLGVDRIAEMATRLGLGAQTGVEMTSERSGLMPTRAWKKAVYEESWHGGDTLNVGIGQGYVATTPMQLAVMIARLANGANAVVPRLVRRDDRAPEFSPLGIDPTHLEFIHKAMISVVNDQDGGTAFNARIGDEALEMAGKTGTAQVRRKSRDERLAERDVHEIPWNERDHALFVGYAPYHAPRYACAAVLEHGFSGSGAAAPVVRDVLREAQRRNSAGSFGQNAEADIS